MAIKAEVLALFTQGVQGGTDELERVGTLEEFVGKGGKITFVESNFKNPNKKLFMDVIQKNGTRGRIFCSKNIGEAIRSNRVELSQLLGLDVILTETTDGDPMLVLIAPTSSTLELEVGNTKATAYEAEAKKIAWEDLAGI